VVNRGKGRGLGCDGEEYGVVAGCIHAVVTDFCFKNQEKSELCDLIPLFQEACKR
jgi:hypothetical protein